MCKSCPRTPVNYVSGLYSPWEGPEFGRAAVRRRGVLPGRRSLYAPNAQLDARSLSGYHRRRGIRSPGPSTPRHRGACKEYVGSSRLTAIFQVFLPSTLMSFGLGIIVPAIPDMAKQFNVSEGLAAQVVTAQGVGRVLALMPAGHSRRPRR